jgi:hypothetical protein
LTAAAVGKHSIEQEKRDGATVTPGKFSAYTALADPNPTPGLAPIMNRCLQTFLAVAIFAGCGGGTASPPAFPDAAIVIYGRDGEPDVVAGVHSTSEALAVDDSPVSIYIRPTKTSYRAPEFRFDCTWDVVSSRAGSDRIALGFSVNGGPQSTKQIDFRGEPILLFEQSGYRVQIEERKLLEPNEEISSKRE